MKRAFDEDRYIVRIPDEDLVGSNFDEWQGERVKIVKSSYPATLVWVAPLDFDAPQILMSREWLEEPDRGRKEDDEIPTG